MHSQVTDLRIDAKDIEINDGEYEGVWGGYKVRFSLNGHEFEGATVVGVRTLAMPCTVVVKDGNITVESA